MILLLSMAEENIFCASVLTAVCCICVIVHGTIIYKMIRKIKGKSPFILLCLSRSVAHAFSSISMTVSMVVPLFAGRDMLIYGLNVVTTPEVSLYPSELFLAFNRFVAVYFWNRYHRIFTFPTLIAITWLAGLSVLAETLARGCVLTFDSTNLQTAFTYDACWNEKTYGQIINLPSIFGSLFLNCVTLGMYIYIITKSRGSIESDGRSDGNIRLFVFSFAECLLWLTVQIVWWSQIINVITSRVGKFFCNTMFSNGGHIIEGLIFIAVYRREMFPKEQKSLLAKTGSFVRSV